VYGGHGIGVVADITVGEMDLSAMDMIVLPGGLGGVASVRACKEAMDALRFAWENGKYVAAICAGPTVLADLGITDGKDATCYPGCESQMGSANMLPDRTFVWDGKLITGTSAGCAIPFGLALIAALKGHEIADTVAAQIVIR
ncbi:MAG: DJ-1/PfpI family protein, partial [Firmicutes bacterium]|nr:DJ-1/PfpI family protein [Bacillota bacterium]